MSQYKHRERQAKGFRREFRMGSLFFWDIVPHPWELVPGHSGLIFNGRKVPSVPVESHQTGHGNIKYLRKVAYLQIQGISF